MTVADITDQNMSGNFGQTQYEESDPYAGYQDYYGFAGEDKRFMLPDGKQYILFRKMNEGLRQRYEFKTSRDIKLNRKTDDAAIRIDTAGDRVGIITSSVTGWHMVRRNPRGQMEPVPFSIGSPGSTFEQWMAVQDPAIINDLHQAIINANPWMNSDLTVEMIDAEIKQLEEKRKEAIEREAAAKNL